MAKALKIVGTVVAVVGLAASAIATGGASIGLAAAVGTAKTVAAVAMIAGAVLAVVASIAFKPKFSTQGSQTKFTTNPQSPIPYCIGRTRMSGVRIHADTWNGDWSEKGKNDILGFAVMLSGGGQIDAIEKFTADNVTVGFNSSTGVANSSEYAGWMAQKVHLGGPQASALALSFGGTGFVGWTSAHKLSGITHALWALRFDFDGKKFGAGVPEPAWIGRWVRVYDPRLDSTYPGGSGTCRPLQEETYVWSRNPALHGLTWALGRWQNGKKTFGIGAPFNTIRVADFVEAANVADANDWYCGGVEYSTESKWTVLKRMLQAGGAVPTKTGAMIGCRVYTPRVSVTTIGADDLLDDLSFAATKPQRDRFNTVIPRYRSEAHEWEVISGSPISVSAYVTADGRVRQKEYDLPLVQHEVDQVDVDGNRQAGQLAAYEIVESREAGPISFTTGPKFLGLKAGDCVNINAPTEGFSNTKVMIIEPPKFDPASGKISFLGQTETDAKHPYALGQVTTPPPPFSLTPPDLIPTTPTSDEWAVSALLNTDGIPVLRLTGGTGGSAFWEGIVIQYKKTTDTDWTEHGVYRDTQNLAVEILVEGDTQYQVRLAYLGASNIVGEWLYLTSVTTPTGTIGVKNAVVFLFQRTATSTAPAVPSTTSTYNFNTAELTGFNNGWATSLPTTGGDYRWMIKATAIGILETDTIATGEWSVPALLSENGTPGDDGMDAVTGRLTNESHMLFAYANGNVVAYTGATGSFVITSGVTDISTLFTLSVPAGGNPQGLTYTLSGRTYTITGGFDANEDTATLTLRATGSGAYSTVVIDKVFSLSKTKGGYEIVATLPTTNLFEGRVVFLESDDKLYRYTGSAWTAAVPAVDIEGLITNSQLETIDAAKITSQITGTQIADDAISTPKILAGSVVAGKIAAGAVTASKLLVTDTTNLWPDYNFDDLNLWVANNCTVSTLAATANNIGTANLRIANGVAGACSATSEWLTVTNSSELLVKGAVWTTSTTAGSTGTLAIEFGSVDAAGVVTVVRSVTLGSRTNSGTNVGLFTQNITTAANEKRFRFVVSRDAIGTSSVNIGGLLVRRRSNGELIVDGSIIADKIAANAVTADKINAGAVTAAKINVTQLSAITATIGTLRTATTGARTEIADNLIRVYDSANVLRVRIGIWT